MKLHIYNRLIACVIQVSCVIAATNAKVQWLTTEHNFGAFREADGPAACTFRFVNTGDEGVVIVAARANCGCTTPQYPREVIHPGDTATISVAYDPAGRPGRFTKYVQVTVSDEEKPQRLAIRGVVIGEASTLGNRYPVDFGPLKLRYGSMMVGKIDKGRLKTSTVEIYNSTADSIRPEFGGMPPYLDVALVPEVIPPGEQATLMAYFRSDKCPLYGLVETKIDIVADPAQPDSLYSLPVTAIVNENFGILGEKELAKAPVATLESTSVDFGSFERSGGELTHRLKLSNTGKSTLEVRRVYTTDAGVHPEIDRNSIGKGKSATIKVTVAPDHLPGELLNARISVITNDPSNPVQTLRVVGEPR